MPCIQGEATLKKKKYHYSYVGLSLMIYHFGGNLADKYGKHQTPSRNSTHGCVLKNMTVVKQLVRLIMCPFGCMGKTPKNVVMYILLSRSWGGGSVWCVVFFFFLSH